MGGTWWEFGESDEGLKENGEMGVWKDRVLVKRKRESKWIGL